MIVTSATSFTGASSFAQELPYRAVIKKACDAFKQYRSNTKIEPGEVEKLILIHDIAILSCAPPVEDLATVLQKLRLPTKKFVVAYNTIFGKGLSQLEEQRDILSQSASVVKRSKMIKMPKRNEFSSYESVLAKALSCYARYPDYQKIKEELDQKALETEALRKKVKEFRFDDQRPLRDLLQKKVNEYHDYQRIVAEIEHISLLYKHALSYCSPPAVDMLAVMEKLELETSEVKIAYNEIFIKQLGLLKQQAPEIEIIADQLFYTTVGLRASMNVLVACCQMEGSCGPSPYDETPTYQNNCIEPGPGLPEQPLDSKKLGQRAKKSPQNDQGTRVTTLPVFCAPTSPNFGVKTRRRTLSGPPAGVPEDEEKS